MATIELIHKRVGNDVKIALGLTDGGVAVDWTTVSKVRAFLLSDQQRVKMGDCRISGPDATDPTRLLMLYPASQPEYLGVARLVVTVTYHGHVSTFDAPLLVFVPSTAEEGTGTVEVEVPATLDPEDNNLEISVTDVDTSLLEEAISDAQEAAAAANEAAEKATAAAGRNPYIGENGHWYVWDGQAGNFVDTGVSAGAGTWGDIAGNLADQTDLKEALDNKVDKVEGKGLSTNDYSDEDKAKVERAYEKPSTGIPGSDIASGVIPDVSNFITNTVNNLTNYYLKNEIYTRAEVQALIAQIQGLEFVPVQTLPTASADTLGKIYLLPAAEPQSANQMDEYYTRDNGAGASPRYTWELFGSAAIDLSGYVTITMLNSALADYALSSDIPTALSQLSADSTHRLVTDTEKATWNSKYTKPSSGIPASDLASGVVPEFTDYTDAELQTAIDTAFANL